AVPRRTDSLRQLDRRERNRPAPGRTDGSTRPAIRPRRAAQAPGDDEKADRTRAGRTSQTKRNQRRCGALIMPTFKRADQEQLEKAQDLLEGSVQELGFAKSLYFGRLKLDEVMPYPRQDIDEAKRTDELIEKVEAFMKEHVDPDLIDREERIPQHVIEGL